MISDMCSEWRCLLCGTVTDANGIEEHKQTHGAHARYGIMWPIGMNRPMDPLCYIPVYWSSFLAKQIGVAGVCICDEGANLSGSMKDYGVSLAIKHGSSEGHDCFYVASSGNHAFSLALLARKAGKQSVVFAPASSSKLPALACMPSVHAFGVTGAIFEDVYNMVARTNFPGMYNVNVSNEMVLPGFSAVGWRIVNRISPNPTHVLSAAGNGTYLAGVALGCQLMGRSSPKIIPVGMRGAFPTEDAFRNKAWIHEYLEFGYPEQEVDAAEGSIAIESYSMPQLMHAVRSSGGFPLGDLTNDDVAEAYRMLALDGRLVSKGVIPEPTGIIPLAAALKWRVCFSKDDILMIVFTGHGAKDIRGIRRFAGDNAEILIHAAKEARSDLVGLFENNSGQGNGVVTVGKDISPEDLAQRADEIIANTFQRR